ncbi:MAG: hypothetical protein WB511_04735 [Nitrososphaeraceae archaeon]
MEEHDFLLEICIAVLGTDKNIRFAGIMDNEGKLLVAKYRKNIQKPLIASSSTKDMSSSSFYAGHLTVSIKKQFESHLGELHFQLTEFERVRLLTIPITSRKDRYLCVSMDNSPNYENIISKILENL